MRRLVRKMDIEKKPMHVLRSELRRARQVPWEKITEAMERGGDQKECRKNQWTPISKEALALKSEIDPIMKIMDRARMKRIRNFVAVCAAGSSMNIGLLASLSNASSYGTFMLDLLGMAGVLFGTLATLITLDRRKFFPEMLKAREKVAMVLHRFSQGIYNKPDCEQLLSLSIPLLVKRSYSLSEYWIPHEYVGNALKSGNVTDLRLELDLVHQISNKEIAQDVLDSGLCFGISTVYAESIVSGELDGE